MSMGYTQEVTKGIYMIAIPQIYEHPNTAHYLILSDKVALIEAAFVYSLPYLEKALSEVGVRPEDIDYIIATHYHIDHTGAIGALLEKAKKARVVIHLQNHKLLTDPVRLVRGSTMAFGLAAFKLYGKPGEIKPVPIDRMMKIRGGEELDLGKGKVLKLIYTPGHDTDHVSIYERSTKTLFPSEAVSVYNSRELRAYLPPASGGPYDIPRAKESIKELMRLDVNTICLPHFGVVEDVQPREFLQKSLEYIDYWLDFILGMLKQGYNFYNILNAMNQKLLEMAGYRSLDQLHEYFKKFWFMYLPKITLMGYFNYIFQYPGGLLYSYNPGPVSSALKSEMGGV